MPGRLKRPKRKSHLSHNLEILALIINIIICMILIRYYSKIYVLNY